MNKPLHVIYITGLGDKTPTYQIKAVNFWRHYGVGSELFQVNWGDKEPWAPKFQRLLARIDETSSDGKSVGLVGISAGASAAINAFAARKDKIAGVVCVVGKINHPETVQPERIRVNPAFGTSIKECVAALKSLNDNERGRILSRYAIYDELVKRQDSFVPEAHNRFSPSFFHVPTIALQITLGAPSFLRFLKHQA